MMKIYQALGLPQKGVVSLVGGGGKTTLMYRLADEIPAKHKVLITTTTKIFLPPAQHPLVLLDNGRLPERFFYPETSQKARPVVGSGLLENNKLQGVSLEQVEYLQSMADILLIEADGSKGRPLKGHLDFEPVISRATTHLIIVIGADILGKPLTDRYVHRPEIVAELTGRQLGSIIDAELIQGLINHPEGILRNCPPTATVVAFINKADIMEKLDEGLRLGRLLLCGKIQKVIIGSARSDNPVLTIMSA